MMSFGGGSGISWTIRKQSAPRSRQITTPTPHHSFYYRPDALPDAQPTASNNSEKYLTLLRNKQMTLSCSEYFEQYFFCFSFTSNITLTKTRQYAPRQWQFDGGKNRGGSKSIRGQVRSPHSSGSRRWLSCRQPACL